jgi:hypothetical protein
MQLLVAHQILIGSAIALAVLFGLRALLHFARGEGYPELLLALASAVVGVALSLYFRKVRARWRASREKLSPRRRT